MCQFTKCGKCSCSRHRGHLELCTIFFTNWHTLNPQEQKKSNTCFWWPPYRKIAINLPANFLNDTNRSIDRIMIGYATTLTVYNWWFFRIEMSMRNKRNLINRECIIFSIWDWVMELWWCSNTKNGLKEWSIGW